MYDFLQRGFKSEFNWKSGVYLWCIRLPDDSYKVNYVGQTIGYFRTRIQQEAAWDYYNIQERTNLDEFAMGRRVPDPCCELSTEEYFQKSRKLTQLFFIPLQSSDSPLDEFTGHSRHGRRRNRSIYKPLESAILRQLQKNDELWRFVWNRRGIELHEPKYPCILECDYVIRGIIGKIGG